MNYIIIYHDGNNVRAAKADLSLWPPGSHPDGMEDCLAELGLPPQAMVNAVIGLDIEPGYLSVVHQFIHIPGEETDYSSGMNQTYEKGHVLYQTIDPDVPDQILDRNGEVVLALCRRCGKGGEIELSEPCIPCPPPGERSF